MKYVCRVRSSVKGGCDVQLSPRTVIVGPNGAGKTTIVQALELATSGFVSDMEGREMVRQSSALGRLFPDKGDMHAEATLADTDGGEERTFSWEMKAKKNGGFYTPKHTAPVNVRFPVTDLTSTLKGDVNTVGVWLEGQVLGPLTAEDILSLLPPAVREDAKTAMDQHGCTDMLVLSKAAAQTAKNLRSQATRTEKTIDSLVEGVAPPMTEARRTEIEAKLAEEPPADSYTQAQVASMQAEVETLRAEARDLLAEIEALPVLDASTSAALSRLKNAGWLIQQHLQHFDNEKCWVCGQGDAAALQQQAKDLSAVESELAPQVRDAEKRIRLQAEFDRCAAALQNRIDTLANAVVREDKSAERSELLSLLAADKAAARTWNNAEAMRKEVAASRAHADRLSLVAKELKKAGQAFLDKKKTDFIERVSSFLPEGEAFDVDLGSARMGFDRDGQLHSALSGAEESRMLLALASSQEDGSTPCVLIPKDRGWDRDTLGHVMAALADSPVQVVIMSTVEPDPVEGWTLVSLE
jgi:hypothetical protein